MLGWGLFFMRNQIRYLIILTLNLVLIACGKKPDKIPEGIILKGEMIEVISEIELTQALIKLKLSEQDTINQEQLFQEVYDEFNVSKNQFNNSLVYYCKEPKVLKSMYTKVIENLTKKQSEHQKK